MDLSERTNHIELARKGGRSKSIKKSQSAKIAKLKLSKKINPETLKLLTDPLLSINQIQRLIDNMLGRSDLSDSNKIKLVQLLLTKHVAIFGQKHVVSSNIEFTNRLNIWKQEREQMYKEGKDGNN